MPLSAAPRLIPRLAALAPELIIFDKDGTLIDFHAMWGQWVTELAQRLELVLNRPIAAVLFKALDFDPSTKRIAPHGNLAVTPLSELRAIIIEVLSEAGLAAPEIERAMSAAWHLPDPVTLAQPLADLVDLFRWLHQQGLKIGVATSDNRSLTEATLAQLGLSALIDALACADDGLPIKPAPDMILAICQTFDIVPAKTIMVGDNVVDLQMGRNAGVGLNVGVLSGLGSAQELAPYADILLPTVAKLITRVTPESRL
jgi:HAD superfamily hydrolase (TIGR01549 family)